MTLTRASGRVGNIEATVPLLGRGGAARYAAMLRSPLKPILVSIVLAAAVAGFGLSAPQAQAAKPCWQTLLNDLFENGRVTGIYQLHCYDDALHNLQTDVKIYGTAIDDIRDAKNQALLARKLHGDGPAGPNTLIVPPGGGGAGGVGGPKDPAGPGLRGDGKGPIGKLADKFGPKDATTLPVPLIVLAGLGMLLLAAAAVSVLARRAQSRRTHPSTPAPVTVSDPPTRR
jgi:hypothetical protein